MRLLLAALVMWAVSFIASGQTYSISTFAGGALPINIPATSASLSPGYLAADPAGDVFFVDQNTVPRLDATTGILTQVAGNGTTGFSGDNGLTTSAQLYFPVGVAVDSAGNLYIADTDNNRIREVSKGGGPPVHDPEPAMTQLGTYTSRIRSITAYGRLPHQPASFIPSQVPE